MWSEISSLLRELKGALREHINSPLSFLLGGLLHRSSPAAPRAVFLLLLPRSHLPSELVLLESVGAPSDGAGGACRPPPFYLPFFNVLLVTRDSKSSISIKACRDAAAGTGALTEHFISCFHFFFYVAFMLLIRRRRWSEENSLKFMADTMKPTYARNNGSATPPRYIMLHYNDG